ncbi:hypothetical protein ACFOQM_16020 [Paenibacillus sp. GCM10012307]|uniref:hypothetical protein n=1 Tax=Paenibacillus sp. GCM10012307 TaxID=3317343 RepID=UPI003620840C
MIIRWVAGDYRSGTNPCCAWFFASGALRIIEGNSAFAYAGPTRIIKEEDEWRKRRFYRTAQ